MPEAYGPGIESLGERHFAFFPAIRNVAYNEWRLKETKWSEVLVENCRTGDQIWIPRGYLGEVSEAEGPIAIVGLTRELEYKAGTVWPYERRVVKMPSARLSIPSSGAQAKQVKPPSLMAQLAKDPEMKVGRLIVGAMALGAVVLVLFLAITFRPVKFKGVEQLDLALTPQDDYFAVVRKLGPPSEDRWREGTGEMQFRLLHYKEKGYTVVLMGAERDSARYIGALDKDGRPVHSVELPGGGSTVALLRRLGRP